MKSKQEFSTILVELDCLLDTRLACVYKHKPQLVEPIIRKKYHERLIDNFYPGYNQDYEKRDTSVLKNAIVTPVAKIIQEFTNTTYFNSVTTPFVKHTRIKLNVYPYTLKDTRWLTAALVAITENKADIEIVSMSPEEITPQYLKNHIQVLVMYDYTKWFDIHSANEHFKYTQCPEVKLFAPAIFFKDVSKEKLSTDPFSDMEEFSSLVIGLNLLPVENFSFTINTGKKKETEKQTDK